MKRCHTGAFLLVVGMLAGHRASAQLTVNVPAGGDVQSASLQVLAAGGGTINLAAGSYYINGSIVLGANTTLNGAGGPGSATQTVIYAPATPNAISMVTQAYAGASNLAVSNLVLDGNIPQAAMLYGTGNNTAYANSPYNNNGIYIYDTNSTTVGVTLTNVEVRHTLRGILTGLVDNLTISGCYFHDNNPGGFSHNMYLVATSGVEIDHTRSNNALTGDGLHIDFGGQGYTIRKSEFSGNNGLGLLSQQDNNVTVADTRFDFNTNEGIQIDAGGLLLTRDTTNYNGGYGLQIPNTADGAGLVYGFYSIGNNPLNTGGDYGPNYVYQAAQVDYTETQASPGPNIYAAMQADGVIGVTDTGDWTLNYGGYTYLGGVDFNASHLTNGAITFQVGNAVATGSYPLVIRYSNGTSSNQTMNLSINGGTAVAINFPSTGSYSSWSTVTTNQTLQVGNNAVTLSVPTGATSAPVLDTLTVTAAQPPAPGAPTNVQGVANGPYSVTLTWTPPANTNSNAAQTYNIYKNNTVPIVATKITGTTWTDTRIYYGETTNQYFVTAVNQGGESGASHSVSVTTGIDAPPGLQVSVAPSTPANNLTWLGVSGAATYLVRRSTVSGGPYQTVATIGANGANNSYSDTSLSNGVNYFYVVAAEDSSGNISVNSYEVKALSQSFTLITNPSSVNLVSSMSGTATIMVVRINGFSDNISFSANGLPAGVTATFGGATASTVQLTLTASSSVALGSYPITVTGTDGGLSSSVGLTLNIGLPQTITFNSIPAQAIGNSLMLVATASSGLPVTFVPVPNGNCSVSGNVVTFLNAGNCGINAYQYGNATYGAAPSVGQIIVVNNPVAQTITFNPIPAQNAGTMLTLTATASSGLPVSYVSTTQSVCSVSGSVATLSAGGTCTIVASQSGANQYGPAASVSQSFTVLATVTVPQVPTDLTSARFAPHCGNANVTQIFADGFLASGQAGVNNLQVVSDPDVVLIGNQWWLIFASNPGPTRGIEPVAAYLPPGVSLSHTGVYPADPNGWHLVGANAQGTGKGVAVWGTPSPAGWDTIAAETPSADVGPDGVVSVYYSGHNLGQTNFQIGQMYNFVNGVASGQDPVPDLAATQPWEFANGLGATLEQSVRWFPELNKYLMHYNVKGWWDNPPDNDIAQAESTDGINWINRQKLNFPISYYNQDFLFNPQWNRWETVVANDPTGTGGASPRDLVWLDSADPGAQYSGWKNQTTLLSFSEPNAPGWRDQGLLSPAIRYGNLPGEENRIYVFFHAYGTQDPLSVARFYCDAITTDPGYTLTAGAPFLNLAPGAGSSMPITVNPTNGFTGTVNFIVSGAPAGVTATLVSSSSANGTTLNVAIGANTAQGRYPITVTGTSGNLTREATFTLNVSGQSQTITIQPLSPNNISYTPGQTYTIQATASSGLPVTLTVGGNGTLNGNVLTVIGGGNIIIAANQAGNAVYSAAPQVTTTLVVAPQVQTVNVASIPTQVVGGTLDLSKYVSATSGLIVDSYNNQTPTICSNNGSMLTFTSVGQCVMIVIQFGNQFYAPAGAVATITVNQGTQTISFGAIPNQTSGTQLTLTATASSGLPVSYMSTTQNVCTVTGSTATLSAAGTCSITAAQAGNSQYAAAANVTQSFTVVAPTQTQTIRFTPSSPVTYGVAPITLGATASSGLAVSYSYVSGPGTLNGNVLSVTGAGTIVIAANQAGNSSYSAATQVNASIVVMPATLTVTANNLTRAYGAANPTLTYAPTGFVNGDSSSVLSGAPALSTTANTTSLPGSYPIAITQGTLSAGSNYTVVFVNGTLQVTGTATTTTVFSASPTSTVYGQSVAFNARVLDANSNPVTGGTVTYSLYNAANNTAATFGTAAVNTTTGIASLSTTSLPAGVQTILAVYVPSASYSASGSSGVVTITPAPIGIAVNSASKVYGATLPTLTGTVGATQNGDVLGASYTTSATAASGVGTYAIAAALTGNAAGNYTATVTPGVLSVTPATLTATATSLSRAYGASNPTLTYGVTGFVNNDTSAVLSGAPSLATAATTNSAVGPYAITIAQGSLTAGSNYSFVLVAGVLTVTQAASQSISFAAISDTVYGSAPFSVSASASSGLPVTMSVVSGNVSLSGATATLVGGIVTVKGAGMVTLQASQAGDGNYPAAQPVQQSFRVAAATLTATANTINTAYGVAFTPTGTLGGVVTPDTFTESFTTSAGTTTPVSAGSYTITPTVTATGATNAANYSIVLVNGTLAVAKAGTRTTLVASSGNAAPGAVINFTVTVASLTSGTPTQTVTLMDGASALGTATLNAGVATLNIASLSPGAHTIVAMYAGDGNFTGSSSGGVAVTVATPSFSESVAPSSLNIPQGQSAAMVITVSGMGGYTGTVRASCASSSLLPCSFTPGTLIFNGVNSTQTITVSIGTQVQARLERPLEPSSKVLAATLLWLPGLLAGMFLLRRRRAWRTGIGLGVLLVLIGLGGLAGCGSSVRPNVAAKGSYSFPILVTDGTNSVSSMVTVVVQ